MIKVPHVKDGRTRKARRLRTTFILIDLMIITILFTYWGPFLASLLGVPLDAPVREQSGFLVISFVFLISISVALMFIATFGILNFIFKKLRI